VYLEQHVQVVQVVQCCVGSVETSDLQCIAWQWRQDDVAS
jgi:hypothetical protein